MYMMRAHNTKFDFIISNNVIPDIQRRAIFSEAV
jgi:hypothetical protein